MVATLGASHGGVGGASQETKKGLGLSDFILNMENKVKAMAISMAILDFLKPREKAKIGQI